MNSLFPIFLKAEQMTILVVGGGNVGLEKVTAILKNSPKSKIKLVAPEIRSEIQELAQTYDIQLYFDKYDERFLDDINLVIAGTNFKEVNLQVHLDCKKRNILVNIADTPELCDFYLSSVVTKGDLKIGISTNGKSPTFAKRIREMLEEILPENLQETLDNLNEIRNKLKGDFEYKVKKMNEITTILKEKEA